MSTVSYRKKIIDAVLELGAKSPDLTTITFKQLAKHCKISEPQISKEFRDMAHLFYEASISLITEHEKRSMKIVQLPGEYALSTLLRHDLTLLHLYERDRDTFREKRTAPSAINHVANYVDSKMPLYYFEILRMNTNLLPNKQINAKLYAHFIVHSMFFFSREELYGPDADRATLLNISRQIISTLFQNKEIDIKYT